MKMFERFVVVMYNKGCEPEKVHEVRLQLFSSDKKSLEPSPSTQAAVLYISISGSGIFRSI
jgi:hypothetical protein